MKPINRTPPLDRPPGTATRNTLAISVLLALLALVSVTAATVAWFTIADHARINSMSFDLTTGANLRFDLDAHATFEEYVKTLSFADISARILSQKGFDMRTTPLEPVTTGDYTTFTLEDGSVVADTSGAYLSFTLHFMATEDMYIHLTSANSTGGDDGTAVSSSNDALPQAMRISFTADGTTSVYDPGLGATATTSGSARTFGLASAGAMVLSNDNRLFYLTANEDKAVQVRIWLEGTDPACTDALRSADYAIKLRFIGTDSDNNPLDDAS